MGWKIEAATDSQIIASKPQGDPADVRALLLLVSKELNVPEGHLEYAGPAAGINKGRVSPVRGYEDAFAAGVEALNTKKSLEDLIAKELDGALSQYTPAGGKCEFDKKEIAGVDPNTRIIGIRLVRPDGTGPESVFHKVTVKVDGQTVSVSFGVGHAAFTASDKEASLAKLAKDVADYMLLKFPSGFQRRAEQPA